MEMASSRKQFGSQSAFGAFVPIGTNPEIPFRQKDLSMFNVPDDGQRIENPLVNPFIRLRVVCMLDACSMLMRSNQQ